MKTSMEEHLNGRTLTCAGLAILSVFVLYQAVGSQRRAVEPPPLFDRLAIEADEMCQWSFDHYQPSAYETEWSRHIKSWQNDVCERLTSPQHVQSSIAIVSRTQELSRKTLGVEPQRVAFSDASDVLMSRLRYKRKCWSSTESRWVPSGYGVQLIEPLWGFLRDPFDRWCMGKRLQMQGWSAESAASGGQSKSHILPTQFAPWAVSLDGEEVDDNISEWFDGAPPWQKYAQPSTEGSRTAHRNVVLDLGSSYFSRWTLLGAGAASGQWLYDTYHVRGGLRMDKFVAVEVEKLSPDEAYRQVPASLVGAYTLMNVPLNMRKGDNLNAADLIRSITRPGDFLALKLDIDGADLEGQLADALRRNVDGLASLVSELFFEHHVDIDLMRDSWGHHLKEDMEDSYRLFEALRRNGIRAHSWP